MADTQLTLTTEEHEFLVSLLGNLLKETRVEEHRTRNLSYREYVVHKDELLESLLAKLGGQK